MLFEKCNHCGGHNIKQLPDGWLCRDCFQHGPLYMLELESDEKELLKLPICPQCHSTEHLSDCVAITSPPWYSCTRCNIEWSASGSVRMLPATSNAAPTPGVDNGR